MLPILYTFRRCPYAMRARWAVQVAAIAVDKHEVVLRDKPPAMLDASPKGTVPVLVLPSGRVIDESLDIMLWALSQHDPEQWLAPRGDTLDGMLTLIDACEREFKPHLDRYKYPTRYRTEWPEQGAAGSLGEREREQGFSEQHFLAAQQFLSQLAGRLVSAPWLGGEAPALADFAIAPFVRQMARHDRARFDRAAAPRLQAWLDAMLSRPEFEAVMAKPGSSAPQ